MRIILFPFIHRVVQDGTARHYPVPFPGLLAEDFDGFEDDDGCPEPGPFTPTATPIPSATPALSPTVPPPPGPDNIGPTIESLVESIDSIWDNDKCGPDEVTIEASATDASGVAAVTLHYRIFDGSTYWVGWRTDDMQGFVGGIYKTTLNPATLRGRNDGHIEYYVEAEDELGNTSQACSPSSPYKVTVKWCSS